MKHSTTEKERATKAHDEWDASSISPPYDAENVLLLRIALTVGAAIGIAPATLAFLVATPVLYGGIQANVIRDYAVSVFVACSVALWGCWMAYATAMASHPKPCKWPVIIAVIVALVWGAVASQQWAPGMFIILLGLMMPGLTATIMLLVNAERVRLAKSDSAVSPTE